MIDGIICFMEPKRKTSKYISTPLAKLFCISSNSFDSTSFTKKKQTALDKTYSCNQKEMEIFIHDFLEHFIISW